MHASSNDRVAAIFFGAPELHALAVVGVDRPQAIINRVGFLNSYAKPYFKELHGRKSCLMVANMAPRLIECAHDIDELVASSPPKISATSRTASSSPRTANEAPAPASCALALLARRKRPPRTLREFAPLHEGFCRGTK